jgi:Ca-activated chloride channel family protein
MEASKAAAQLFVDQLPPKMRVGVVSFSETSYLNQAPTTNHAAVKKAISKLYPRTGTAIGYGLELALDTLYNVLGDLPAVKEGEFAPAIVVLLTDGENTDGPSPLEVVDSAIQRGVRVYTIGVGSPESSTVHVGGAPIQARLDESTLKELAQLTNAKYYNASTEKDLRAVYQTLTTQLITRMQPTDISFMFVATAFVFGVGALLFAVIWSNRLP